MSTNPLAPEPPFEPVEKIPAEHLPETDSEPDYDEPANGVDNEPGEIPEDELPEPDPTKNR